MYFYPVNVKTLRTYLDGYFLAVQQFNLPCNAFSESLSFHDWVALKENFYESTSGWEGMIDANSTTESEDIGKFFKYYREYRNRVGKIIFETIIPINKKRYPWKTQSILEKNDLKDTYCYLSPYKIQIVKYSSDKGVFTRYLDCFEKVIEREEYSNTLDLAFEKEKNTFGLDENDWQKNC